MEIIALKEYTDKTISLYEGQIRNIGKNLAQKLIAQGVVAEHDESSSGSGSNEGGNSNNIFTVTITAVTEDDITTYSADKTTSEISDALQSGSSVICSYDGQVYYFTRNNSSEQDDGDGNITTYYDFSFYNPVLLQSITILGSTSSENIDLVNIQSAVITITPEWDDYMSDYVYTSNVPASDIDSIQHACGCLYVRIGNSIFPASYTSEYAGTLYSAIAYVKPSMSRDNFGGIENFYCTGMSSTTWSKKTSESQPFIVNIGIENVGPQEQYQQYTADKTYAEIRNAALEGRIVYGMLYDYGGVNSTDYIPLSYFSENDSLYMVDFNDIYLTCANEDGYPEYLAN